MKDGCHLSYFLAYLGVLLLTIVVTIIIDRIFKKIKSKSFYNTNLWVAWLDFRTVWIGFVVRGAQFAVLWLWWILTGPVDNLWLKSIELAFKSHIKQADIILGAAIATSLGFLSQRYSSKINTYNQNRKSARILYHDLTNAQMAIGSFKTFIEEKTTDDTLWNLVDGAVVLQFDDNWRQHCIQLLDKITDEHYRKISELYYYLEQCATAIKQNDIKSLKKSVYRFSRVLTKHVTEINLSSEEIIDDLKRLSEGTKIRKRTLSNLKYEIKYYRMKHLKFNIVEQGLVKFLKENGSAELDELIAKTYTEGLVNILPSFFQQRRAFDRVVFEVAMSSSFIKCIWNECSLKFDEPASEDN